MGLLTCARCGCAITAERKKTKYTYHRCTGHHGKCGNTYIREEQLAELSATVVERIRIPGEIADWIADGLRQDQRSLDGSESARITRQTHTASPQRAIETRPSLRRLPGGSPLSEPMDPEIRGVGDGADND
jgi:recombinase-like zinc beta ribbon protein